MFRFFILLAVFFLLPAYAEEQIETSTQPRMANPLGAKISIGPGATLIGTNAGIGANLEIGGRVSYRESLFFSFLVNYSRWSTGPSQISGFQAVPCFVYHFENTKESLLHPYLGGGVGVANFNRAAFGISNSAHPVFLIRPGIEFTGLTDEEVAIGIEARLGLIEGAAVFMPQMTWSVTL